MEYFSKDNYLKDINDENPKGITGGIARAFGELIKLMWFGHYSLVTPRVFYEAFAPDLLGCQDQQEIVRLTLDRLHRDLNKIKQSQTQPTAVS